VIKSLRASFTNEGILKAWAIEDRLMDETWLSGEYDLLPRLNRLSTPTLVIHGEYDFVPVDCAAHIAEAIPGARFVLLRDCGHFSFLESPDQVHKEFTDFFRSNP
jgi:proline iminopeptidase